MTHILPLMVSDYFVGDVVHVMSRHWPGINKPGGVGRIIKVNEVEDFVTYDVSYTVMNGKEKNIEEKYIRLHDFENPADVHDRKNSVQGRCRFCHSFVRDCKHSQEMDYATYLSMTAPLRRPITRQHSNNSHGKMIKTADEDSFNMKRMKYWKEHRTKLKMEGRRSLPNLSESFLENQATTERQTQLLVNKDGEKVIHEIINLITNDKIEVIHTVESPRRESNPDDQDLLRQEAHTIHDEFIDICHSNCYKDQGFVDDDESFAVHHYTMDMEQAMARIKRMNHQISLFYILERISQWIDEALELCRDVLHQYQRLLLDQHPQLSLDPSHHDELQRSKSNLAQRIVELDDQHQMTAYTVETAGFDYFNLVWKTIRQLKKKQQSVQIEMTDRSDSIMSEDQWKKCKNLELFLRGEQDLKWKSLNSEILCCSKEINAWFKDQYDAYPFDYVRAVDVDGEEPVIEPMRESECDNDNQSEVDSVNSSINAQVEVIFNVNKKRRLRDAAAEAGRTIRGRPLDDSQSETSESSMYFKKVSQSKRKRTNLPRFDQSIQRNVKTTYHTVNGLFDTEIQRVSSPITSHAKIIPKNQQLIRKPSQDIPNNTTVRRYRLGLLRDTSAGISSKPSPPSSATAVFRQKKKKGVFFSYQNTNKSKESLGDGGIHVLESNSPSYEFTPYWTALDKKLKSPGVLRQQTDGMDIASSIIQYNPRSVNLNVRLDEVMTFLDDETTDDHDTVKEQVIESSTTSNKVRKLKELNVSSIINFHTFYENLFHFNCPIHFHSSDIDLRESIVTLDLIPKDHAGWDGHGMEFVSICMDAVTQLINEIKSNLIHFDKTRTSQNGFSNTNRSSSEQWNELKSQSWTKLEKIVSILNSLFEWTHTDSPNQTKIRRQWLNSQCDAMETACLQLKDDETEAEFNSKGKDLIHFLTISYHIRKVELIDKECMACFCNMITILSNRHSNSSQSNPKKFANKALLMDYVLLYVAQLKDSFDNLFEKKFSPFLFILMSQFQYLDKMMQFYNYCAQPMKYDSTVNPIDISSLGIELFWDSDFASFLSKYFGSQIFQIGMLPLLHESSNLIKQFQLETREMIHLRYFVRLIVTIYSFQVRISSLMKMLPIWIAENYQTGKLPTQTTQKVYLLSELITKQETLDLQRKISEILSSVVGFNIWEYINQKLFMSQSSRNNLHLNTSVTFSRGAATTNQKSVAAFLNPLICSSWKKKKANDLILQNDSSSMTMNAVWGIVGLVTASLQSIKLNANKFKLDLSQSLQKSSVEKGLPLPSVRTDTIVLRSTNNWKMVQILSDQFSIENDWLSILQSSMIKLVALSRIWDGGVDPLEQFFDAITQWIPMLNQLQPTYSMENAIVIDSDDSINDVSTLHWYGQSCCVQEDSYSTSQTDDQTAFMNGLQNRHQLHRYLLKIIDRLFTKYHLILPQSSKNQTNSLATALLCIVKTFHAILQNMSTDPVSKKSDDNSLNADKLDIVVNQMSLKRIKSFFSMDLSKSNESSRLYGIHLANPTFISGLLVSSLVKEIVFTLGRNILENSKSSTTTTSSFEMSLEGFDYGKQSTHLKLENGLDLRTGLMEIILNHELIDSVHNSKEAADVASNASHHACLIWYVSTIILNPLPIEQHADEFKRKILPHNVDVSVKFVNSLRILNDEIKSFNSALNVVEVSTIFYTNDLMDGEVKALTKTLLLTGLQTCAKCLSIIPSMTVNCSFFMKKAISDHLERVHSCIPPYLTTNYPGFVPILPIRLLNISLQIATICLDSSHLLDVSASAKNGYNLSAIFVIGTVVRQMLGWVTHTLIPLLPYLTLPSATVSSISFMTNIKAGIKESVEAIDTLITKLLSDILPQLRALLPLISKNVNESSNQFRYYSTLESTVDEVSMKSQQKLNQLTLHYEPKALHCIVEICSNTVQLLYLRSRYAVLLMTTEEIKYTTIHLNEQQLSVINHWDPLNAGNRENSLVGTILQSLKKIGNSIISLNSIQDHNHPKALMSTNQTSIDTYANKFITLWNQCVFWQPILCYINNLIGRLGLYEDHDEKITSIILQQYIQILDSQPIQYLFYPAVAGLLVECTAHHELQMKDIQLNNYCTALFMVSIFLIQSWRTLLNSIHIDMVLLRGSTFQNLFAAFPSIINAKVSFPRNQFNSQGLRFAMCFIQATVECLPESYDSNTFESDKILILFSNSVDMKRVLTSWIQLLTSMEYLPLPSELRHGNNTKQSDYLKLFSQATEENKHSNVVLCDLMFRAMRFLKLCAFSSHPDHVKSIEEQIETIKSMFLSFGSKNLINKSINSNSQLNSLMKTSISLMNLDYSKAFFHEVVIPDVNSLMQNFVLSLDIPSIHVAKTGDFMVQLNMVGTNYMEQNMRRSSRNELIWRSEKLFTSYEGMSMMMKYIQFTLQVPYATRSNEWHPLLVGWLQMYLISSKVTHQKAPYHEAWLESIALIQSMDDPTNSMTKSKKNAKLVQTYLDHAKTEDTNSIELMNETVSNFMWNWLFALSPMMLSVELTYQNCLTTLVAKHSLTWTFINTEIKNLLDEVAERMYGFFEDRLTRKKNKCIRHIIYQTALKYFSLLAISTMDRIKRETTLNCEPRSLELMNFALYILNECDNKYWMDNDGMMMSTIIPSQEAKISPDEGKSNYFLVHRSSRNMITIHIPQHHRHPSVKKIFKKFQSIHHMKIQNWKNAKAEWVLFLYGWEQSWLDLIGSTFMIIQQTILIERVFNFIQKNFQRIDSNPIYSTVESHTIREDLSNWIESTTTLYPSEDFQYKEIVLASMSYIFILIEWIEAPPSANPFNEAHLLMLASRTLQSYQMRINSKANMTAVKNLVEVCLVAHQLFEHCNSTGSRNSQLFTATLVNYLVSIYRLSSCQHCLSYEEIQSKSMNLDQEQLNSNTTTLHNGHGLISIDLLSIPLCDNYECCLCRSEKINRIVTDQVPHTTHVTILQHIKCYVQKLITF